MAIAPVCDFRELDHQLLRDKKLDALASQTDAYRMMREADLFFQDAAIGQPHTEPQLFVIHNLLAAGCHPGQGFEDKLKTAITILEEGMIALRAVKASARSSETSSDINKDGLWSLRQMCNIDQEFELRVYRNESNKAAYDTLGVMGFNRKPQFEHLDSYYWASYIGLPKVQRERNQKAAKFLSVIESVLSNETSLHRKTDKCIVLHAWKLGHLPRGNRAGEGSQRGDSPYMKEFEATRVVRHSEYATRESVAIDGRAIVRATLSMSKMLMERTSSSVCQGCCWGSSRRDRRPNSSWVA